MTVTARTQVSQLHHLARLYGVQTAYQDVFRRRRGASPETLLAVLRGLGAPTEGFRDIPGALRERRQALWQRVCNSVVVAWDGGPIDLELRLPPGLADSRVDCHLELEGGEVRSWGCDLGGIPTSGTTELEGVPYVTKRLMLSRLPWGYHRLRLAVQGRSFDCLVIAAPPKSYTLAASQRGRIWGVFLPVYALHSPRSWGGGDLSDLEALIDWVTELGGGVVGTLPLLATFLDEPFDPSPYAPASRLFWNELYLDVTRVPELEHCPAARTLLGSPELRRELEPLRSSPLVDHRHQAALKRKILQELACCLLGEDSERRAAFRRFLQAHPALEDYARFRATGERHGTPWTVWPQPQSGGALQEGDYDEEARRYHLYAQWLTHEQFEALSKAARQKELGLYLDLPLGVHPAGYDVWRHRAVFALGARTGAPPDAVFTKGQNWGVPPLHPERIREQGYNYYLASLRHHLRYARILRIDHVMGFHRLFWVPNGLETSEGAYVRYRDEEFYAILTLESHRHRTLIVGEDLGTVPTEVHAAMARHEVHRMYVMQYELGANPRHPLRAIPPDSVASLNTHDMPPFASFWQGLDIPSRLELGLLDDAAARMEGERRLALNQALVSLLHHSGWLERTTPDAEAVLRACLAYLGASPARVVLVNLEDLWLETSPQNVPGSRPEHPNWRRKARYALETFSGMARVHDPLHQMDHLRRRPLKRSPRS